MHLYQSFRLSLLFAVIAIVGPSPSWADDATPWKSLFNGRDLTGWKAIDGALSEWHADNGVLFCDGSGHAWLATVDDYKNFELELEFRVPPGGNSGIFLRAAETGNPAFEGMEIQVLDDPAPEYATIQPAQHCGSLYGLAAAKPGLIKKAGEWQKYLIVCDGQRVKVTLNGSVAVDANLADYQDDKTHPGVKRTTGHIGLQNHSTRIEYRNIRIHTLP